MEKSGVTKAALARDLGVSHVHVLNWINGQSPRVEQFAAIARFFNVSMEWLLTGEGRSTSFKAYLGMLDQLKGIVTEIYPGKENHAKAKILSDRLEEAVQPLLNALYEKQEAFSSNSTEWQRRAEAAERILSKIRASLEDE